MEFDLGDPTIMDDMIINVYTNLTKSFNDFCLQDLFRIHQKDKLGTNKEFYVDVSDRSDLELAIDEITKTFCTRTISYDIQKKLQLKPGERPNYLNSFWMIGLAFRFSVHLKEAQDESGSIKTPSESESAFQQHFRLIRFESIEQLSSDYFNENIRFMEKCISSTLSSTSMRWAVSIQSKLVNQMIGVSRRFKRYSGTDPQEYRFLMLELFDVISDFFGSLLEHYKDRSGEKSFDGYKVISGSQTIESQPIGSVWSMFSADEPPSNLACICPLFNGETEGVTLSLEAKDFKLNLVGCDLKRSPLSNNSRVDEKLQYLSTAFEQVVPHIWFSRSSSYILSNSQMSLFFMLPVSTGFWKEKEDTVSLLGAPLKYLLIDHSYDQEPNNCTLRLIVSLKIFDGLLKVSEDNLGMESSNDEYHILDNDDEDKYRKFMRSLIEEGFTNKIHCTKDESGRDTNHETSREEGDLDDSVDNASDEEGRTDRSSKIKGSRDKRLKRNEDGQSQSLYSDQHFSHRKSILHGNEVGDKVQKPTFSIANKNDDQISVIPDPAYRTNERISDEIGSLYPVSTSIIVENGIIDEYSNTISIKLHVPVEKCLKKFPLRYPIRSNGSQEVFIKLFDIYWSNYLHSLVFKGFLNSDYNKFNDSDLNVISLLRENKIKDFSYIKQRTKKSYLREIIAMKRIEAWNMSNPSKRINSPKLLRYGWAIFNVLDSHLYGGPFIVQEKLEFINQNSAENIPKRIKSFKRQRKLLKRAGIQHQDLKSSNLCFDHNDECYIIDFGMSVVDNDEIFNRYDISDLATPEYVELP